MFSRILRISLLLCIIYFGGTKSEEELVVETTYGKIQGRILTTDQGNQYYAFQEIPYASPPTGDLRFKEPVPPKMWDDILQTTQNTKICHQIERPNSTADSLKETEDCLYLNIYTPMEPGDESESSSLPVIVWIHGGTLVRGDSTFSSHGPKYLMDYDIVIVTINYRLGPLGFLTTEDGVIPANLGLKDQYFALQWVKSNIKLFGGDPSKVTIMGESAGAVSVGYHLLNTKSKGLFRAAILQSGTAISSFSHQRWAKYFAFQSAYALNPEFTSNSSTELLEYLQSVPAQTLTNVKLDVPTEKENGIGSHRKSMWLPVIENENLDNAFIIGLMHENMKNGNINKVPILIGFNSEEELSFVTYDILEESKRYDDNLELLINNKYDISKEDKKKAAAEMREIYTEGKFEDNYGSIVKFLSDEPFSTPATRQAYLESHYTDVYLYEFSHKGVLGANEKLVKGTETVAHGEEEHYLWDLPTNPDKLILPVTDILTRNRLLKLWTNFVKYLNPTPEDDPLLNYIKWPKVVMDIKHEILYLNINTTLEVKADPKHYKQFEKIIGKYVTDPLSNSY